MVSTSITPVLTLSYTFSISSQTQNSIMPLKNGSLQFKCSPVPCLFPGQFKGEIVSFCDKTPDSGFKQPGSYPRTTTFLSFNLEQTAYGS